MQDIGALQEGRERQAHLGVTPAEPCVAGPQRLRVVVEGLEDGLPLPLDEPPHLRLVPEVPGEVGVGQQLLVERLEGPVEVRL